MKFPISNHVTCYPNIGRVYNTTTNSNTFELEGESVTIEYASMHYHELYLIEIKTLLNDRIKGRKKRYSAFFKMLTTVNLGRLETEYVI